MPEWMHKKGKKKKSGYVKYKTGSEKTKQKMIDKAAKKLRVRKNFNNLGRILEGPEGGRFTSSGRKKKQLPDEF